MSSKPCVSCGDLVSEDDAYFGDEGVQCQKCYYDADTAQMWNKGVIAHAVAPLPLAVLGFCFNPFFLVSVATFMAVGNAARVALASKRRPEDLGVSPGQRIFLIISAVIAGLLGLLTVLIDILRIIGTLAG